MSEYKVSFSNVSSRNEGFHRYAWTQSLDDVLESGSPILGERVIGFENNLAAYLGVNYAVGVANGTDALSIALLSIGIEKGDTVAIVANAGGYSSIACNQIGAEVVYVDIDENCQMSPQSLEEVLTTKPEIRAVIVTYLYGLMGDVELIQELCRKKRVLLVEDCAQAIGCVKQNGNKAGSFGDAATFSFYPTKNLGALGDGGAILTNDDSIAEKARSLRQYGWSERFLSLDAGGRNSRLDEFQAAGLDRKLESLDEENKSRVETWSSYKKAIDNKKSLTILGSDDGSYNGHLCVIYSSELSRQSLSRHFEDNGIQTLIHYPYPDYKQPGLCPSTNKQSQTEMTDLMCEKVLSIPLHPHMEKDSIEHVIRAISSIPEESS